MDLRRLNVDMRLLRYFSVLAEELHFGRAAARLHISQPPLSQQIKLLERDLQTQLFVRTHHHVELTSAGRMLKEQVRYVFEQFDRALTLTCQAGRGEVGRLEVGMISSVMIGLITRSLQMFQERYPGVDWRLHELTPMAQIEALEAMRIDVCFFRLGHQGAGLRNELLISEPVAVALPERHRLTRYDCVELGELAQEPFVSFELQQSTLAKVLHQICMEAGFVPRIVQQVTQVQTLLCLVRGGFGVALLPVSAEYTKPPGVVFRPLKNQVQEVPLYAIYRDGDVSPTLELFLQTVRELARRHAQVGPAEFDGLIAG